eukprot:1629076-Pleurochrysis_carterae.AAC.2
MSEGDADDGDAVSFAETRGPASTIRLPAAGTCSLAGESGGDAPLLSNKRGCGGGGGGGGSGAVQLECIPPCEALAALESAVAAGYAHPLALPLEPVPQWCGGACVLLALAACATEVAAAPAAAPPAPAAPLAPPA